ncbi:hypothetical protein GCM10025864_10780 [Luteimicrobium album]|uniref:Uncharacterized protein n=1 Tax=Luteimicrobium album TaxID=1054550 RepID=A0ABQ6HXT8_9MICO|nr:hypothetical protein GCM10025864_10780 [Luteimicrobium album]
MVPHSQRPSAGADDAPLSFSPNPSAWAHLEAWQVPVSAAPPPSPTLTDP